jgi:hypothetical protein
LREPVRVSAATLNACNRVAAIGEDRSNVTIAATYVEHALSIARRGEVRQQNAVAAVPGFIQPIRNSVSR